MPRTERTRILLVEDHAIVRGGLVRVLQDEPDLAVCGEAETAQEALDMLPRCRPDIAIVDIGLKDIDGLRLIRLFRRKDPALRILVLSMHDEQLYAGRAVRAGARGYLMKEETCSSLLDAVRTVLAGELWVSSRVKDQVLHSLVSSRPDPELAVDDLSDRERQVFRYLGMGWNSRTIAERLHVSVKTVDTHRARIKVKLGIDNAHHLILAAGKWAQREGVCVPSL